MVLALGRGLSRTYRPSSLTRLEPDTVSTGLRSYLRVPFLGRGTASVRTRKSTFFPSAGMGNVRHYLLIKVADSISSPSGLIVFSSFRQTFTTSTKFQLHFSPLTRQLNNLHSANHPSTTLPHHLPLLHLHSYNLPASIETFLWKRHLHLHRLIASCVYYGP